MNGMEPQMDPPPKLRLPPIRGVVILIAFLIASGDYATKGEGRSSNPTGTDESQ